jgi:hypothetical protein
VEQLLDGATEALGAADVVPEEIGPGPRGRELAALLRRRNGFYAFASALHVFPFGAARQGYDLEAWNAPGLWREEYGDLADGHLFFAEDAFGNQFSLLDDRVVLFDAETAEPKPIADEVSGWVEEIVAQHRFLTGWPLAVEYQEAHGPLRADRRLMPRTPFVLGGDYVVENVRATIAVEAMRVRGVLARQLRDAPDGTTVRLSRLPAG